MYKPGCRVLVSCVVKEVIQNDKGIVYMVQVEHDDAKLYVLDTMRVAESSVRVNDDDSYAEALREERQVSL